jgi:hypothetical protein
MITTIEILLYGMGAVVLALTSFATITLGPAIDAHPKGVSKGIYPSWSHPIPATRIFTTIFDGMYTAGGVILYLSTDKTFTIIGIMLTVSALIASFTAVVFGFAVIGALNAKEPEVGKSI